MGILDKFKFWKKDVGIKDETALPETGFAEPRGFAEPGYRQPPSRPSYPSYTPEEPRAFHERFSSKELEIINAKLDAIRANLESINQRIANLERIAYGETRGY